MAAWAGAAVSAIPAVAAARAAAVRAFFGEAMRRMKETDTENLLRRGRWIARMSEPRLMRGPIRRRRDPFGLVAPGDVLNRTRLAAGPQ
ncbi:hypothetical protein Scel_64170 [Streptomyces cellostaticus]|nr:hypothetical protein Scel_64170 [Streptomyces cellostaticus]